jgi:uncharacterized protein (TIGR02300 family)
VAWSPPIIPFEPLSKGSTVVKAELGTKRTCPSCAARFYDLLKSPIVCPKCGASFLAATILPSKGDFPAPVAPVKPREPVEDDVEAADVELVSLEDAEAPDTGDDETAGIEDVDLGEEAGEDTSEEDDTFLVEEEEEGDNMSGLLDGGSGGKEEEEEP